MRGFKKICPGCHIVVCHIYSMFERYCAIFKLSEFSPTWKGPTMRGLITRATYGTIHAVCIFDKVFASFWHLTRNKLHENKMYINWHAQFRIWHVVWLVKDKITRQLTLSKLKWHVLLGIWHWSDVLEGKCRCQLTFHFVFENVTKHFGFEVECQWNLSNIHNASIIHGHLSPVVVIVWKVVGEHLFLNITPSNFMAKTGWKQSLVWGGPEGTCRSPRIAKKRQQWTTNLQMLRSSCFTSFVT